MLNQDGEITECSQSNFFVVKGADILTPPLAAGLLPGITREYVLQLAADLGYQAKEARLTPADLPAATEAFITGTTREITPVVAVDDAQIGNGRPGPVTTRLLTELRARVSGHVVVS
jgi:branched-chain amino acid aminotransferase